MNSKILKFTVLIILFLSGVMFLATFSPGYFLSKIIGTDVSARLSISQLLLGNIRITDVYVFSSKEFVYGPAITIKQIDIKIDPISFYKKKTIEKITVSGAAALRLYDKKCDNNLDQIKQKITNYLNSRKGNISYVINEFILTGVAINTYSDQEQGRKTIIIPGFKAMHLVSENRIYFDAIARIITNGFFYKVDQAGRRTFLDKVSNFI